MKGFIDERGNDRPACVNCKYRNKPTTYVLCYNCIPVIDLALHKPNCETEFVNFTPADKDGGADG